MSAKIDLPLPLTERLARTFSRSVRCSTLWVADHFRSRLWVFTHGLVLQEFFTVLVVEDDDAARDASSEALWMAGFAVFTARSLNGGCNLLRNFPGRCLILLDLHLSDGEGSELLDFLHTLPDAARRFPVIVVSADPDLESYRRYPFVIDVVPKPVDATELLTRVIEHARVTPAKLEG